MKRQRRSRQSYRHNEMLNWRTSAARWPRSQPCVRRSEPEQHERRLQQHRLRVARKWNAWRRRVLMCAIGATLLCLILLLSGCASTPEPRLALTKRVVVSCPQVFQPTRLAATPAARTNGELLEYTHMLIEHIETLYQEAEAVAADCREWVRSQQQ